MSEDNNNTQHGFDLSRSQNQTVSEKLSTNDYALKTGKCAEEFTQIDWLGKGGYGQVYRVREKTDQLEYALKKIRIIDQDMSSTLREVEIWSSLESEFIVQFRCAWFEDVEYKYDFRYSDDDSIVNSKYKKGFNYTVNRTLFIQMELCHMTLDILAQQMNDELCETEESGLTALGFYLSCELFLEIIEGINYLHSHNPPLIHRDIKPTNILIKQHSNDTRVVKIGDFGLTTEHNRVSMSHTSKVGTEEFIAPQVKKGRQYTSKSDIYSVGVVMSKLFLLEDDRNKTMVSMVNTKPESVEYYTNTNHRALESIQSVLCNILKLQNYEECDRPNASEINENCHNYCPPFNEIKRTEKLTNVYYKWSVNSKIGSDLLDSILQKHLTIDNALKYVMTVEICVKTNITDETLTEQLYKKINHGLYINSSFSELKEFLESELKFWNCAVIESNEPTIKHFIKAVTKHSLNYYLYYDSKCYGIAVILINSVHFHLIKFIFKKYDKTFAEILNNNELLSLAVCLEKSERLNKLAISDFSVLSDPKIADLLSNSKFVHYRSVYIYIATNDNQLFVFDSDSKYLKQIEEFDGLEIRNISLPNSIATILTESGLLYSWEIHGTLKFTFSPKLYSDLIVSNIITICATENHSLALTISGVVFAWGRDNYGQLGNGNDHTTDKYRYHSEPKRVYALQNEIITEIACGSNHSMALTSEGTLYSWGHNACGQLGVGDQNDRNLPTLVVGVELSDAVIIKIACNMNSSYILSNKGDVYSTGLLIESENFARINNETDKFVDICADNDILIAVNAEKVCYVFGLIKACSDDKPVLIPLLINTTLCCIQNCIYVFYDLNFTNKPICLKEKRDNNANTYEIYKPTKPVKEELQLITKIVNMEESYSTVMEILNHAFNNYLSLNAIKLLVDESKVFSCYLIKSPKREWIDETISFMNDNNILYFILHDNSYQQILIAINYVHYSIINFDLAKTKQHVNLNNEKLLEILKQSFSQKRKSVTSGEIDARNYESLRELSDDRLNTIELLAIGYKRTFFKTKDDKVYSFGDNSGGSLGNGLNSTQLSSAKFQDHNDIIELSGKRIGKFFFAFSYMVALTECGLTYSWGFGHLSDSNRPVLITQLSDKCVKHVCCASNCIVLLTERNEVFIIRDKLFTKVENSFLLTEKVTQFCANYHHVFLLTENYNIFINLCENYKTKSKGTQQKRKQKIMKYTLNELKPQRFISVRVRMNGSYYYDTYILSSNGNIYSIDFGRKNSINEKHKGIIPKSNNKTGNDFVVTQINHDSNKFTDLYYSECGDIVVAQSTNGNCFLMNRYLKNLTETPITSIENALAVYSKPQVTSETIKITDRIKQLSK